MKMAAKVALLAYVFNPESTKLIFSETPVKSSLENKQRCREQLFHRTPILRFGHVCRFDAWLTLFLKTTFTKQQKDGLTWKKNSSQWQGIKTFQIYFFYPIQHNNVPQKEVCFANCNVTSRSTIRQLYEQYCSCTEWDTQCQYIESADSHVGHVKGTADGG